MIGSILSVLVAASYLALAGGSVFAPEALARTYGVVASDDAARAYLRATGARDAVLGLLLLNFLFTKRREPLATTVLLSALVGASDFAIVSRTVGAAAKKSLALHGIGTLGLLCVARLIRSGA